MQIFHEVRPSMSDLPGTETITVNLIDGCNEICHPLDEKTVAVRVLLQAVL